MDSLKLVAEKVKSSPQVIRKKFATAQSPYSKVTEGQQSKEKHQEDWLHAEETLKEGIPFYVKNLGTWPVFQAQGSGCTDEAVHRIVESTKKNKMFHSSGSSLQKVLLRVSTRLLKVEDMVSKESIMEVPIYRVSYCTADPNYPKVFAFICREARKKDLNCYAFLCNKDSMAQAMALTVADAFKIAYDAFEKGKAEKNVRMLDGEKFSDQRQTSQNAQDFNKESAQPSLLVAKAHEASAEYTSSTNTATAILDPPHIQVTNDSALSTVDDSSRKMQALDLAVGDDDFDAEFTKLAESRSNPNLFETPVRRRDFSGDVNHLMATDQTAKELMMSKSSEDLLSM